MVFSESFHGDAPKQSIDGNALSDGQNPEKRKRRRGKAHSSSNHAKAGPTDHVGKRPAPSQNEESSRRNRSAKKRKTPPSEEALKLSETLKDFSRRKKLDEALKIYWDKANDQIRDGHHACIIVDCCARCGDITAGEKVVDQMKQDGTHVNVETKTALLKGYAHSGKITQAESLFESMCSAQAKSDHPNVRTLNTLLRGCLWSAVDVDDNGVVSGGIVTAERAWKLSKKLEETDSKIIFFDVSSYEYLISLLCQALNTSKGESRIQEMKEIFGASGGTAAISQSLAESLALSYLALARAYATLHLTAEALSASKQAVEYVELSREALKSERKEIGNHGKCAWRQGNEAVESRRASSNAIYRGHRLSEVEMEAKALTELSEKTTDAPSSHRQLARRLLSRLIVLSGGGTTDLGAQTRSGSSTKEELSEVSRMLQSQILNTTYFSYGLAAALKKMDIVMGEEGRYLRRRDCNRVLGCVGLQGGIVDTDGCIDFERIFKAGISEGKKRKRRKKKAPGLEIELGSGFGDWIVRKAIQNPSTSFVSVELRADRVAQTFARTAALASCTAVDNLCMVGAESASFLLDRVQDESVSTIYINHPEPPTQTFGSETEALQSIMEGGAEPAHMVNSNMIAAAANCLSRSEESRLIIVTDNRWYGRLICATLVKVCRQNQELLVPIDLAKQNGNFKAVESFPESDMPVGNNTIQLFDGQPDGSIGHPEKNSIGENPAGTSYFDRLWRSGGGAHAEKSSRFIMVMARKV